jgi:tRNA A37 threonylcarbamoyladenosine dehydratase
VFFSSVGEDEIFLFLLVSGMPHNYPIMKNQTPLPSAGPALLPAGLPRQFASSARLFSAQAFQAIQAGHVGVVGLGGVGSWAVEALARSGVGALTLVDMDHVAESNLNRQVQALHSVLGMEKVQALAGRIRDIAPDCQLTLHDVFLGQENVADIFATGPSVWIDASDDLAAKKAMILFLKETRRLKALVVSGGAGGKTDPTRVEAGDLSLSQQDPLLSALRYDLRRHHGFPLQGSMKIQTVFSRQPMVKTDDCDPAARLACAGYGSLVTVTASMGMAAAGLAINKLIDSAVNA